MSGAPCTTPTPFTDLTTANPFCGEIEFLDNAGISTGYSDGSFGTDDPTTRQATAAFLVRFENYVNGGS